MKKIKNSQPKTKFTGSYKKSVYLELYLVDLNTKYVKLIC